MNKFSVKMHSAYEMHLTSGDFDPKWNNSKTLEVTLPQKILILLYF